MTPLAKIIHDIVLAEGPMPLDRYMGLCLGHPQYGYYVTRDPFGSGGDFTTAPEISQVFGELIGVWVASVWALLGEPRHFALVELGPGRGTLMADILRVLAKAEKCAAAANVHLVETSPVLREAQKSRLPHATWHHTMASLPALPTILIANEFFDALPIRQFERKGGKVYERCIGVGDTGLQIGLVPSAARLPFEGDGVFEDHSIRTALATALGNHLATVGGAALIIDYGHGRSAMGDTLQALRRHGSAPVTQDPGEVDITSHVDFEALGRAMVKVGARVLPLKAQGDFLKSMGLETRRDRLVQKLSGEARTQFLSATERLAHHAQMGQLFKVMAVTSAGIPAPYPFGGQ